jgi:hypothetical protein
MSEGAPAGCRRKDRDKPHQLEPSRVRCGLCRNTRRHSNIRGKMRAPPRVQVFPDSPASRLTHLLKRARLPGFESRSDAIFRRCIVDYIAPRCGRLGIGGRDSRPDVLGRFLPPEFLDCATRYGRTGQSRPQRCSSPERLRGHERPRREGANRMAASTSSSGAVAKPVA